MANTRRRRRSTTVVLGITTLLAAGLTACGTEEEATHQAVCTTQQGVRVDDKFCDDDEDYGYFNGYGWYYIPVGNAYAPIGAPVTGGTYHPARKSATVVSVKGGAKASGGTVARVTVVRGGFGGSSGSGRGYGG